jgi:sortase A
MKRKMFRNHKANIKTLVVRWVSIVFLIVGIGLIGYTIKAIVFKPDYAIKTEYDENIYADDRYILPSDHNESTNEVIERNKKTIEVVASYEEGDYIGSLIIPALNYELPIYEGTEKLELEKGVGRYIGSALPGETDNCVLSGHRDTVFSKLGELKLGETVIVKSEIGLFTYEVDAIRIVEADDRTVIVPKDEATLTLTTCYPFVYIGFAPQRYIVSAKMISPSE